MCQTSSNAWPDGPRGVGRVRCAHMAAGYQVYATKPDCIDMWAFSALTSARAFAPFTTGAARAAPSNRQPVPPSLMGTGQPPRRRLARLPGPPNPLQRTQNRMTPQSSLQNRAARNFAGCLARFVNLQTWRYGLRTTGGHGLQTRRWFLLQATWMSFKSHSDSPLELHAEP